MTRGFIPAPNTASVELIYNYHGVIVENIFHVQQGAPFTLSQLQALRAVVLSWYDTSWRGMISSDAQLARIRTKALDSTSSPMEDYPLTPTHNGTNVTASAPNNVTLCIKLQTGLAGRSQRGRWYVIGLAANTVVNGVDYNSGGVASLVTGLNTLIANLNTNSTPMVITSFRNGNAWRTTAHNTPVVTAVAIDNHLDSQRRRLAGRGQ